MPKYSKWTPEDDRRILELHGAGKSRARIAVALNRTIASVNSRLFLLKQSKNKDEAVAGASSQIAAGDPVP